LCVVTFEEPFEDSAARQLILRFDRHNGTMISVRSWEDSLIEFPTQRFSVDIYV
jgi:hypothetical protein